MPVEQPDLQKPEHDMKLGDRDRLFTSADGATTVLVPRHDLARPVVVSAFGSSASTRTVRYFYRLTNDSGALAPINAISFEQPAGKQQLIRKAIAPGATWSFETVSELLPGIVTLYVRNIDAEAEAVRGRLPMHRDLRDFIDRMTAPEADSAQVPVIGPKLQPSLTLADLKAAIAKTACLPGFGFLVDLAKATSRLTSRTHSYRSGQKAWQACTSWPCISI